MYEDEEYGFCPECGALMKNGVCLSCGYDRDKKEIKAEDAAFGENGDAGGAQPLPPCDNDGGKAPGMPPTGPQNIPPYGSVPGGQNGPSYGTPGGMHNGQLPPNYDPSRQYGPQPNGYYGQIPPQGPPPYGQAPYGAYPNMPPQKKNNSRTIAAVIIAVIAVLLCIVMVLVFVIVKSAVRDMETGVSRFKNFGEAVPEETIPYDFGSGDGDRLPDFGSGGIIEPETEEAEEGDYTPSPEDDFYVTLANAERDDLSYKVDWKDYSYVDDETGATAIGRYPQLTGGNIPHLDELNEEIEYEATYYTKLYGYYRDAQAEDEKLTYITSSVGYVTYMDEEKISIVLKEDYLMNQESYISLYCINIDLVSGELMDNGEMIEYTELLAKEFRDQDAYQNDTAEAVARMSDEELRDFLSDSDTNIIFYTPVGLEIGFNYTTSTSSGWVTATIKDYGRYMKKI